MTTGLAASLAANLAFAQDSTMKKAAAAVKAVTAAPKPAGAVPAKPAITPAKPALAVKPMISAKPVVGAPVSATNPVVLTVGTETITKADFEAFLAGLPDQVKAQMANVPKKRIAEQIADIKVYAAEARRRHLDQTPMAKIEMDQALASSLFRDIQSKNNPTEADMVAYYEKNKSQYEKLKARHILLRFKGSPVPVKEGQKDLTKEETLAKALEIKKALDAGGDFAEIAKKESDDAGSGANGGDLGAFGRGMMVPPFEQAAFALPIGKVSDPVESQFGYHIIQVQEQLGKTFASVKSEIEPKLKPELAQKSMQDIKAASKIVFNDTYFAEPAPPAPPAPPAAPKP